MDQRPASARAQHGNARFRIRHTKLRLLTRMLIHFHNRKKIAALSLLEVMIAVAISAILVTTIMALTGYTARSFAAISNYVTLDRGSRHALDRLSKMVREADGVMD